MVAKLIGKVLRILAMAAVAGCSPRVGGSVVRADPPLRQVRPTAGRSNVHTAGPSALDSTAEQHAVPPTGLSVPDPAVQPLVMRAWALERTRRFREAAATYAQASARLSGSEGAAMLLMVRSARLYERSGDRPGAYLALEAARRKARLGFERLFVLRRMYELARRMDVTRAVVGVYRRLGKTPGALFLVPAVAAYWQTHGKVRLAERVIAESKTSWARIAGLLAADRSQVPGRVGLLVSLRGPYRRAGWSVIRGASLALTGSRDGTQSVGIDRAFSDRRLWIETVDGDTDAAVQRLSVLGRVGVVVGPVWPAKARQAARQAQLRHLPLIAVSPDSSIARVGSGVFDYMPDVRRRLAQVFEAVASELLCRRETSARLRARAGCGRSRGRRRRRAFRRRRRMRSRCRKAFSGGIALIVPEGTYGRSLAASLRSLHPAAFDVFGYRRGQTTFSDLVAELRKKNVSAVVAVMSWRTLELFAPQMAAAGLWPGKGPKGRKSVVFGALGDGILPARLRLAQRYLDEAFLVPGFYPDEGDPRWGGFVADYRRTYGTLPDLVAAYAYEAASIALRAVQGPDSRDPTSKILSLTVRGKRVFDAQGALARPSLVYKVRAGGLVPWRKRRCRASSRGGGWRRKR